MYEALFFALVFIGFIIAYQWEKIKVFKAIFLVLGLTSLFWAGADDTQLCSITTSTAINSLITNTYYYCANTTPYGSFLGVYALIIFILGALGARIIYYEFRKG